MCRPLPRNLRIQLADNGAINEIHPTEKRFTSERLGPLGQRSMVTGQAYCHRSWEITNQTERDSIADTKYLKYSPAA